MTENEAPMRQKDRIDRLELTRLKATTEKVSDPTNRDLPSTPWIDMLDASLMKLRSESDEPTWQ